MTNCSPMRRMARSTPARISGSPPRATRRMRAEVRECSLAVAESLPVTTRPQVAAFTNKERECPRWASQLAWPILSRMRASRVASSGMRKSASARHMSATPSALDRSYSWISASTPLRSAFARRASTSRRARARALAAASGASRAPSSRAPTASVSGMSVAAVMAARAPVWAMASCVRAANGPRGAWPSDSAAGMSKGWEVTALSTLPPRGQSRAGCGTGGTPVFFVPAGNRARAVGFLLDRPRSWGLRPSGRWI